MKCRLCGTPLAPCLSSTSAPRHPPTPSSRRGTDAPETVFPLRLFACTECWLVQMTTYSAGRRCSRRLRLFSLVLERLGRACGAVRRAGDERLASVATSLVAEVASNDGYLLQYVVGARHSLLRHRADRQHRRRSPGQGHRDSRASSSGPTFARGFVAERRACRSDRRQQRARPRARHQRFRRRACAAADAARRRHLRVSAPAAVGAADAVRYRYHEHYSYLSLTRCSGSSRAHGLSLRCRGRCRRMAAACGSWRSMRRIRGQCSRGRGDAGRGEMPPACAASYYHGFQALAERDQERFSPLPARAERAGKQRRRLWRRGQGQHAAQLRRREAGPVAVRRRRPPHKQGRFLPGAASRCWRRRRCARTSPTSY